MSSQRLSNPVGIEIEIESEFPESLSLLSMAVNVRFFSQNHQCLHVTILDAGQRAK